MQGILKTAKGVEKQASVIKKIKKKIQDAEAHRKKVDLHLAGKGPNPFLRKRAYQAYKPPKQAPDSKAINRGHQNAVPSISALAKKSMKKQSNLLRGAPQAGSTQPAQIPPARPRMPTSPRVTAPRPGALSQTVRPPIPTPGR